MSLGQLKSTWENLGQADPLWAVLTDPAHRDGKWDIEAFMATGRTQVEWINRVVTAHDLSLGDTVLDFGCGVGRLTNALAERTTRAVGVDIAVSMVEHANALNQSPDRIRFVSYDGRLLPFADGEFDSAVSLIVLQHAPPAVQLGCLLELQRVVRVGGVLLVQIPSQPIYATPLDPAAMRAGIRVLDPPGDMTAGRTAVVRVAVTNDGTHSWPVGHMIKLGNHWYHDDVMVIQDDARTDLPWDVAPGETAELDLMVTAPVRPGAYRLELDMMQEHVAWWQDEGSRPVSVDVEVHAGDTSRPPEVAAEPIPAPPAPVAAYDDLPAAMQMHGLHVDLVRSMFAHCGSTVVAVIPDAMAGPEWESYTYLVRRDS
ncbi:class I SAM-dependent methyltransferase [Actinophytocola sp.]|uniref:class I SAM-dependent methyltransferase n=1 Tax=Actinophytocola sp. TaxID=1872138 RepID=UPI002D811659|nr:class I SAM-dependent methyltransferase [Actinophytocola sp.]HET9142501.1 class I SAM-dependent methyltransferase [Actinophytocola sp.]